MVNSTGVAAGSIDSEGKVFVHGELWNAHSDQPISDGEPVRIVAVKGLRLEVEKEKAS